MCVWPRLPPCCLQAAFWRHALRHCCDPSELWQWLSAYLEQSFCTTFMTCSLFCHCIILYFALYCRLFWCCSFLMKCFHCSSINSYLIVYFFFAIGLLLLAAGISVLSHSRGVAVRKTSERIEYTTESEVEETELEQTRHNLRCSLLRPTAYTDSR